MVYVVGLIKDLCNRQVTVHGTGFWHPCQNDGIFAKMRIADAVRCICRARAACRVLRHMHDPPILVMRRNTAYA